MQHQIPAAWIGTASPHGSCYNPKFTLGLLHTQGGCLTTLYTASHGSNHEEEVSVSLRETVGFKPKVLKLRINMNLLSNVRLVQYKIRLVQGYTYALAT